MYGNPYLGSSMVFHTMKPHFKGLKTSFCIGNFREFMLKMVLDVLNLKGNMPFCTSLKELIRIKPGKMYGIPFREYPASMDIHTKILGMEIHPLPDCIC